jgi:hypothetical protein
MTPYTKLTPTKRSIFGYTRLWLASDHILLLNSSRFAEDYKRFSFSDIQSIVITELPPRIVPRVMMILAALAWMGFSALVDIAFFRWFFIVTGAGALLVPIVDIARGPRCRCTLHTRVSKERLEPVSRMAIARRFLAVVQPRIEAVQGALSVDQIAAVPNAAWQPPPPALVASPGYVPEALFGLFLINAILIWTSVQFPKIAEIPGVLINTLLTELLLILVALIWRRGRDPRVVTYVIIVLALIGFAFDTQTIGRQLFSWYLITMEKARGGDKAPTVISLFPNAGHRAVIAYSWHAADGILGLAAAFWERRKP